MSRLLDRPTNAERKRRDLREPRFGVADAAARAPDQARWAEAAAVLAAQNKAAAKVSTAEDERFWAEVKQRLAEVEQQRRVRDAFSPDEVRALAQAAGARDLLAKIEAEALERDAAAAQRFLAQQPVRAAAEAKLAAAAASITQQRCAHAGKRAQAAGARRQPARARPGAGLRRLFRPLAHAAALFALGLGASALWLQPAAQDGAASSRAPAAVQPGTSAARPPALKVDADAAGFAARAAAPGPAPRRMQPRN